MCILRIGRIEHITAEAALLFIVAEKE